MTSSTPLTLHPLAAAVALIFLAPLPVLAQATTQDQQALPTVTVNASADASADGLPAEFAGGQVARGSRLGVLGNVDNLDSPVRSVAYTQQLIADQQAHGVGDVLKNDPVVRTTRGFGNFQESYMIRGFIANSDDLMYNGLFGILPRQYVASEMMERVEKQKLLRSATSIGHLLTGWSVMSVHDPRRSHNPGAQTVRRG